MAQPSQGTFPCVTSISPYIDYGNYFYTPQDGDPIHTLQVNLHVMQFSADDPMNFRDISEDRQYLLNLINNSCNSEIFGEENVPEICDGNNTNAPFMVDSRIRLSLDANNIFYHMDPIGFSNNNSIYSAYLNNTYLSNNQYPNALNIFLCRTTGAQGIGQGFLAESTNYIIMNRVYEAYLSDALGTDIWDVARVVSHEVNHCLGLHHSWTSQSNLFEFECDVPTGFQTSHNHNMGYSNVQNYMSPLQWGHARRMLLTTWRSKQIVSPIIPLPTFNLTENYTVDVTDKVYLIRNLVVKSGNTLTIQGSITMDEGKEIIVERGAQLIIDGGIITSCGEKWNGINVEGNTYSDQSNAGVVKLMNGAIIENATDAISTENYQHPWPQFDDYRGGLVQADNSTIRNCDRAVAFTKYALGNDKDQSYFNNCTFENLGEGVTIWANNGVTFQHCTFNNIDSRGIHTYDSEVIVRDGCVFNGMPKGVDIRATYPSVFTSKIGSELSNTNEFICSDYGVYAEAADNNESFKIVNNNFIGGVAGVHVNGLTHMHVHQNDFYDGEISIESVTTGSVDANLIEQNNINASRTGVSAVEENDGLRILNNCFDNSISQDIYSQGIGIHPFQGNEEISAGNCFTKGNIPEIINEGTSITYFIKDGTPESDCKYPKNSTGIVILDNSTDDNQGAECGSNALIQYTTSRDFCRCKCSTKQEIMQMIAEIQAKIDQIQNDTSLSPWYKEYLLNKYMQCLRKLKKQVGVIIIIGPNDDGGKSGREEVIKMYQDENSFEYNILAYGLMVESGALDRATNYLNVLARMSTSNETFLKTQEINLSYLKNTESFKLTSVQKSQLHQLAINNDPYSGYARSLYTQLTGEDAHFIYPKPSTRIEKRSEEDNKQLEIKSWPNPVQGNRYFLDMFNIPSGSLYKLAVYDISGRLMYQQNDVQESRTTISTDQWKKGIYFLKLTNENQEEVHNAKIIIVN